MPWARLDDRINNDAKLLALSDAAHRMWTCGLAYCQFNLTDGFVPDHAIHAFGVRAKNKDAVAGELCAVQVAGKKPLWRKVDNGYQFNDYLDWNDSRDKVLRERALSKARLDRHNERKKNGVVNAVVNVFRNTFGTPHGTGYVHPSTYHVPQELEKQERADAPSCESGSETPTERIERLNAAIASHRRRRSGETDDDRPATRVITALARDVLRQHPDETDDLELRTLLKEACARANLKYDATAVGEAMDQAKAQVRRTAG